MPLDFTKLIWAALIGYLAFAEVPDIWTWVGGFIIFASSTYIAYRESRVAAPRPAAARAAMTAPPAG
jgi:drug/metabolite transporter (DMT)-like permease